MTLARIMMLMLGPLYNHQGEPQFERRQNWVKGKFDICIGNPSQEQELLLRCYQMVQLCYLFQKNCYNWQAVSASVNIIIYPASCSTTSLLNHSHDQDCSHQHPSATWWACKKEARDDCTTTDQHHHHCDYSAKNPDEKRQLQPAYAFRSQCLVGLIF